MAINGLTTNSGVGYTAMNTGAYSKTNEETKNSTAVQETDAVVYEKSGEDKAASVKEHKIDYETVERLKAEADERNAQLKGLVEKMLLKQAGTSFMGQGLASVYRSLEVDEETRAQAQKDIAEDGYWGVEQTSDRILSFAKALAGDNLEYAQQMLDAVKKGFKQAGEEWGEDLPELSKQTMDATYKKFDEWIKSLGGTAGDSATDAEITTAE